jgi:hypothetical protein
MNLFQRKLATAPTIVDQPHVISESVVPKRSVLFEKFLKEYDKTGDLKFSELLFRKGAPITEPFGLQNGFKMVDGKMEWGYVRLHAGVDRARGGKEILNGVTIEDVVRAPFYAHRSEIFEYGDTSYGTLIVLYNDEYRFEFRIAHMNPDTKVRKQNEKGPILPQVYARLKQKSSFERNTILGSAGSWGASTGAHTHTEIRSYDSKCEVLELLLEERFGTMGVREYDTDAVIEAYRKQKFYKTASSDKILHDYAQLREDRKTIILNPYKCEYVDWDGKIRTRYSTEALFNGL